VSSTGAPELGSPRCRPGPKGLSGDRDGDSDELEEELQEPELQESDPEQLPEDPEQLPEESSDLEQLPEESSDLEQLPEESSDPEELDEELEGLLQEDCLVGGLVWHPSPSPSLCHGPSFSAMGPSWPWASAQP